MKYIVVTFYDTRKQQQNKMNQRWSDHCVFFSNKHKSTLLSYNYIRLLSMFNNHKLITYIPIWCIYILKFTTKKCCIEEKNVHTYFNQPISVQNTLQFALIHIKAFNTSLFCCYHVFKLNTVLIDWIYLCEIAKSRNPTKKKKKLAKFPNLIWKQAPPEIRWKPIY